MMISADALHLGPLMLPWNLLIIVLALLLTSWAIPLFAKKYSWSKPMQQTSQDLLWSSFVVGLLGARLIFVLLHVQLYWVTPLDIFKIQDKGFHFWGGVATAVGWYGLRNIAMKSTQKIVLIGLCIAFIGIGVALKHYLQPKVNFPDVTLTTLDGQNNTQAQVTLADFIGQPTVVNLWASWCPPCHREMPVLARAAQQYPQIQFVMLNQGEDRSTVTEYLQRHQFRFEHVLLDPSGEVPTQINSFGLPTTLFFNAQGQLIERHMGELSPAMLQQYLAKISPQP